MKKFKFLLWAPVMFTLVLTSCDDKNDDDEDPFVATQADLDAAMTKIAEFTGGSFPHGPASTGDSTYRVVYANKSDLSGTIEKGTIVTKATYKANSDGSKSNDLLVTFAMIKRESTYDPDSANWEYVMMGYDAANDYNSQPNGTLPDVGNAMRGTDVNNRGCIDCHSKAGGGDYLFVND